MYMGYMYIYIVNLYQRLRYSIEPTDFKHNIIETYKTIPLSTVMQANST